MTDKVKKPIHKKWWFWVTAAIVVLAMLGKGGGDGSGLTGESGAAAPAIVLPEMQSKLIEAASFAQAESRKAENDMQRGGIKSKRDKAICNAITTLAVTDWIGVINKIDSNSDGKGVLQVEISPDVIVKTWNNALSDSGDQTLLEPNSPVFEAAAAMKEGQKVVFSGSLLPGDTDKGECIKEGSISLRGKISEPEFLFKFSSIYPYTPTKVQATAPAQTMQPAEPVVANTSAIPSPTDAQKQNAQVPIPAVDVTTSPAQEKCVGGGAKLFSCVVKNGKLIELCDLGKEIQYSFGRPQSQLDIVLKVPREQASTQQWNGMGPIAYSVDVPKGDTTYSVFFSADRMSDGHPITAGVNVVIRNKPVATVLCDEKTIVNNLEDVNLKPAD